MDLLVPSALVFNQMNGLKEEMLRIASAKKKTLKRRPFGQVFEEIALSPMKNLHDQSRDYVNEMIGSKYNVEPISKFMTSKAACPMDLKYSGKYMKERDSSRVEESSGHR